MLTYVGFLSITILRTGVMGKLVFLAMTDQFSVVI